MRDYYEMKLREQGNLAVTVKEIVGAAIDKASSRRGEKVHIENLNVYVSYASGGGAKAVAYGTIGADPRRDQG